MLKLYRRDKHHRSPESPIMEMRTECDVLLEALPAGSVLTNVYERDVTTLRHIRAWRVSQIPTVCPACQ